MFQPQLFEQHPDKPLKGTGAVRTWSGNLMEEVVCLAMGWKRLAVDGSKVFCADAQTQEGRDVEIKSVRLSGKHTGKSFIYDWRMKKEAEHSPNLLYAFAGHLQTKSTNPKSLAELIDSIAAKEIRLAVVHSCRVHQLAKEQPLNKAPVGKGDKRTGYNRKGYCEGYRNVPVGVWFPSESLLEPLEVELYGRVFRVLLPQ